MINQILAPRDVKPLTPQLFHPGLVTPAMFGDPVHYLIEHRYTQIDDLPASQQILGPSSKSKAGGYSRSRSSSPSRSCGSGSAGDMHHLARAAPGDMKRQTDRVLASWLRGRRGDAGHPDGPTRTFASRSVPWQRRAASVVLAASSGVRPAARADGLALRAGVLREEPQPSTGLCR
jgi:hypothetical protein